MPAPRRLSSVSPFQYCSSSDDSTVDVLAADHKTRQEGLGAWRD